MLNRCRQSIEPRVRFSTRLVPSPQPCGEKVRVRGFSFASREGFRIGGTFARCAPLVALQSCPVNAGLTRCPSRFSMRTRPRTVSWSVAHCVYLSSLLVQHFVEIHDFVGQHGPSGKFRWGDRGVCFRIAVGNQFCCVIAVRLIIGFQFKQ